ncbi:hypothetical protein MIMGU_mgv1a0166742mg, partial [Erythranthe guttata]
IKNWFSKNKTDRRSKDTEELPVEPEAVSRNKSIETTEGVCVFFLKPLQLI